MPRGAVRTSFNRGWGAREQASSLSADFGLPDPDFRKQMGSTFVNTPWRVVDERVEGRVLAGVRVGHIERVHMIRAKLTTRPSRQLRKWLPEAAKLAVRAPVWSRFGLPVLPRAALSPLTCPRHFVHVKRPPQVGAGAGSHLAKSSASRQARITRRFDSAMVMERHRDSGLVLDGLVDLCTSAIRTVKPLGSSTSTTWLARCTTPSGSCSTPSSPSFA